MMSSGIPLPEQLSQQPGGGIVAARQGINAMNQGSAKAQYAPYNEYADAYLKNQQAKWLPYQYRMQALSNPMLWMAAQNNPALRDQITKMMSDPMQGIGNGAVNIPQPGQGSGVFDTVKNALLSKLGIGGDQTSGQNGMNSQPGITGSSGTQDFGANNLASPSYVQQVADNGNGTGSAPAAQEGTGSAMVPATQGTIPAVGAAATKEYNTQIPGAGQTYRDPNTGQVISAATGRSATSLQTSITAAKRVAPQLERIASDAAPFMTLQDEAKTWLERGKIMLLAVIASFQANMLHINRN